MNRRHFLTSLAVAATTLIVPERKFFRPPRGGWGLNKHLFKHELVLDVDAIGAFIHQGALRTGVVGGTATMHSTAGYTANLPESLAEDIWRRFKA